MGVSPMHPSLQRQTHWRGAHATIMTATHSAPSDRGRLVATIIVWLIVGACCIAPILWIVIQLVFNPLALSELRLDSFRVRLISRTLLYNGAAAIVATLLAIPAAIVLGRGRGIFAAALWFVLPISLLLPSLTFAYGWKQWLRLAQFDLEPAGLADIARCVWSLATWLFPVPAIVMGLSLRPLDTNLQQQAQLDGVLWRVTARQILAPAIAATAIVAVLAMQEFAVYEPTGISVIATETRMVFETGAFSSPDNPITQQLIGSSSMPGLQDQRARAAAAVAVSVPMLIAIALLAMIAGIGARKLSAADAIESGTWPRSLDTRFFVVLAAWLIVLIAIATPLVALALSLKRKFNPPLILAEFGPQIGGSILIASLTGALVIALALAAAVRRNRVIAIVALTSFLLGGQLVAIALIRLYNHPSTVWLYQSALPVMMAYVARFGWIVLFAAGATFSAPWRSVRDLAAVDGASSFAAARYVVWPLAWPLLGASALFVTALSLSEVPATVLLAPQRPQMLVPLLMTWVHMLRYDPMIEASLLTAGMVVAIGLIAVLLGGIEIRTRRRLPRPVIAAILCLITLAGIAGCNSRSTPQEIWLNTGTGPGQVVYPRGICYSPGDDTFFVVDRAAHVQHLDRNGTCLSDWRMPQSQQGKPVGLSVGPDGNLYVPDTHYHRVIVYKPDGTKIREFGGRGTAPGQFIYPTDIAFDSRGYMFVAEYGDNDRIQVFDREGTFAYQFGKFGDGPGEFSRPQSIVIDNDYLYVTDACNHRIGVFKTDGTFVRNMGSVGSGPGEFRFPYGMDMDRDGDLIVCEFGNNRLQKIDKQTGKSKGTWGAAGREDGQLAYPWGVAVDKHDRVVAVDAGNNRLQVFKF
ncbi:hypothetical protein BH09PLA1_BH09PLA1_01170 [soil metagenome]